MCQFVSVRVHLRCQLVEFRLVFGALLLLGRLRRSLGDDGGGTGDLFLLFRRHGHSSENAIDRLDYIVTREDSSIVNC